MLRSKFFGLKISREAEYSLRIVLDLSLNFGQDFVKICDIAKRQHIPQPFLELIVPRLRRDGLISTRRGLGGGCRLGRGPDQITVGDILAAVGNNAYHSRISQHPFHAIWVEVDQSISAIVDSITFADLAKSSKESPDL